MWYRRAIRVRNTAMIWLGLCADCRAVVAVWLTGAELFSVAAIASSSCSLHPSASFCFQQESGDPAGGEMSSSQGRMQTPLLVLRKRARSRCGRSGFVAPETRAHATNGLPLPPLCQTFPQSRVGYAPDAPAPPRPGTSRVVLGGIFAGALRSASLFRIALPLHSPPVPLELAPATAGPHARPPRPDCSSSDSDR
jgi:hypothetical protein